MPRSKLEIPKLPPNWKRIFDPNDLLPGQQIVLDYIKKCHREGLRPYIVWPGGIRGGKTGGSVYAMMLWTQLYPGDYILGGYTAGSIVRNTRRYIEIIGGHLEQPLRIVGGNQPHVDFGHEGVWHIFGGATEVSQNAVQGSTMQGMYIDELTRVVESYMAECESRLSEAGAFRALTFNRINPYGWVAERYDDRAAAGELKGALHVTSTARENHHLDPEFVAEREAEMTDVERRRRLDNEAVVDADLVFPMPDVFEEGPPCPITSVSVDVGTAGTTAALGFSEAPLVLESVYQHHGYLREDEHIEAILKQFELAEARGIQWIVDRTAVPMIKALRERGATVRRSNSDRVKGIRKAQSAILNREVGFRKPGCLPFLREAQQYRWSKTSGNTEGADHCSDAFRYRIMGGTIRSAGTANV